MHDVHYVMLSMNGHTRRWNVVKINGQKHGNRRKEVQCREGVGGVQDFSTIIQADLMERICSLIKYAIGLHYGNCRMQSLICTGTKSQDIFFTTISILTIIFHLSLRVSIFIEVQYERSWILLEHSLVWALPESEIFLSSYEFGWILTSLDRSPSGHAGFRVKNRNFQKECLVSSRHDA